MCFTVPKACCIAVLHHVDTCLLFTYTCLSFLEFFPDCLLFTHMSFFSGIFPRLCHYIRQEIIFFNQKKQKVNNINGTFCAHCAGKVSLPLCRHSAWISMSLPEGWLACCAGLYCSFFHSTQFSFAFLFFSHCAFRTILTITDSFQEKGSDSPPEHLLYQPPSDDEIKSPKSIERGRRNGMREKIAVYLLI